MSPLLFFPMVLGLASLSIFFSLLPLAAFFGVAGYLVSHLRRLRAVQRTRPALTVAATRLDLSVKRSSVVSGTEVSGVVSGFEVTVDQYTSQRRTTDFPASPLRIRVKMPLERLALFSRGADLDESRFSWSLTFDDAFDCRFRVYGVQEDIAARLDAGMRRRLIDLNVAAEIRAFAGELTLVLRRPIERSLPIVKLIENAVAVAFDLTSTGPSVPDRLLTNAIGDPNVAVRYQNLAVLLSKYPLAPQAREGLRVAWEARERGMRYLAAIRLGEDGFSFLTETISMTAEPVRLRVMALRHLATCFPRERACPMIIQHLNAPALPLREAAVELAGRLRIREAVPTLADMSTPSNTATLRALVAQALGEIGAREGEPALVTLLDAEPIAIKLAAVVSLGRIGSARALPHLRRLTSRYMSIRELVEAARKASREIESRTIGRGELSIASSGSGEGALSLTPPTEGALSLSTHEIRSRSGRFP